MVQAVANGNRLTAIGGDAPTNGAVETIEASMPYVASVTIQGVADILFGNYILDSPRFPAYD